MSRSVMRPISTVARETLISPHNDLLVFWWRPAHDGQVVDVTAKTPSRPRRGDDALGQSADPSATRLDERIH